MVTFYKPQFPPEVTVFVTEAHSPAEKSLEPECVEIIWCPKLYNILNESQYKKQMFIPVSAGVQTQSIGLLSASDNGTKQRKVWIKHSTCVQYRNFKPQKCSPGSVPGLMGTQLQLPWGIPRPWSAPGDKPGCWHMSCTLPQTVRLRCSNLVSGCIPWLSCPRDSDPQPISVRDLGPSEIPSITFQFFRHCCPEI